MSSFPAGNPKGQRPHVRYLAALLALLVILSAAIGYLVFRHLVANEERQVEETLHHIADIRSAAVSAWLKERSGDAVAFGNGRFLGEAIDRWVRQGEPPDEAMRQLQGQLLAIKNTYGYLQAAILDSEGWPRISTDSTVAMRDAERLHLVQRALSSGSPQFSSLHPVPDSQGEALTLDIFAPLLDIHGQTTSSQSVLYLKVNVEVPLDLFVRSIPLLSASTDAVLTEIRDGRVLVDSASEKASRFHYLDTVEISPDQLKEAAGARQGAFSLKGPQGTALVSVVRKIDSTPWYMIIMVEQNALRESLHRLAWVVALISAVILLLLASAVFAWWRKKESDLRFQTLEAETGRRLLQRQYDYLSKYANDMIVLADANNRILDVNYKAAQELGYQEQDLVGAPLAKLFPPECHAQIEALLAALHRRGTAFFETEQQRATGEALPVEISARAIRQDGQIFLQLICRDVSERKQAEAALRESQARLNGILTSVLDAVWSFSADLSQLNYINPAGERMYGHSRSALAADPHLWFDAIHPDDRNRAERAMRAIGAGNPTCEAEYRIIDAQGEVRWLHCRARLVLGADGKPLRIDGLSTDITQRKQAEQQVHMLAYYDNVTGLPNRSLINDRLAQATHMSLRSQKKVAVLYMDLDNFKYVNDSLGHQAGDMLLRSIAETLQRCVREEDTVGRLGGDEFLVVLPDIERGEQAVSVAEKILAATARPYALQGQEVHTTMSIGISIFPDDAKEPQDLIRYADSALYQAKSRGRDNFQFFTEELNHQINRSTTIERQLRHAIDSGELSVWYQPQVDSSTGRLIGAEALLRWRHGNREFLAPVEFIPVAEERGLIGRIGEWVLREACRQSSLWQSQGLPMVPVSVNVSPLQFQQKGFVDMVIGILEETRLDAACLELEITESAIMRRASLVATLATTLREAGVRISIDDFGTGYSSLSYLKHIPIDKIKIDRTFVADMLEDKDDEAITYAIISLARSLNLRVIAEGVESKAQVDRLHAFGCDEVQGNYYSSAVCAEDFCAMLRSQASFETASA